MNDGSAERPQLWLIPAAGRAAHQRIAEVAVRLRTQRLRSYSVPAALDNVVGRGSHVRVPVGRSGRAVEGIVLRISEQEWDGTLQPLLEGEPPAPWLSPELAGLAIWVSRYYGCAPFAALAAFAPSVARRMRTRAEVWLHRAAADPEHLSKRQAAVWAQLEAGDAAAATVLAATGVSAATLRTMQKRGLIERSVRRVPVAAESVAEPAFEVSEIAAAEDALVLTAAQAAALEQVTAELHRSDFRVFVLFGVPGSGKTEVYVRAIRRAVALGRQAIVLIPEVALATQLVDRLSRRFARVAVLHSALPAARRRDTLAAIAAGKVDVVIGTRSAVFAPCPALGLIVVDEEQEPSFKNLTAPYYHARDVAVRRAQLQRIPLVLGSATPALETWFNATRQPHYTLLRLPERASGAAQPRVQVVRPRADDAESQELLSPELSSAIAETLHGGGQAILLHNRRGYASALRCARCGLVVACERCGAHLVFHQDENGLKCHRCGLRRAVPPHCLNDSCQGRLARSGLAIQRLEQELRRRFPAARLLRLDSDTMRHRSDYEAALRSFERRDADLMIGTQMVAKGLDFPGVRLVGVIDADAALGFPDFRAAERVFQLAVQVVGRAGRRDGAARAIIQAEYAAAPAIACALRLDYEAFAAGELRLRERLNLPPYTRLARLVLADRRANQAREQAERLSSELARLAERLHAGIVVEPAAACIIGRVGERLRYQVTIVTPREVGATSLLAAAFDQHLLSPRVERFRIDVDPVEML